MSQIKVDFLSSTVGEIRPLHGVNSGPMTKAFTYDARELFREGGFPFSRLHDVEYPYGSGEFVDIPCIFKDFNADETNEDNYNFGLTDEYIKHIIEVGSRPIFRLGVSIEHAPIKRYIYPPSDYEKWARICEHIILHYNEGWANGYHWNIDYWEIWNEADGGDNMWLGSPEQFYELYCVSATYLKNKFPDLKIGGCAFTRSYNDFTVGFFKYIASKETRVPLDFYSWHKYFSRIDAMLKHAELARKLMKDHGYGDAESIFDEWNYMRDWLDQFDSYPKIKNHEGAAYCAATLCAMQTQTDIDVAAYFEADVVKEWCGLFEVKNMAIAKQRAELAPLKPFYAFKCFNALYNMKNEKAVCCEGEGLYAVAAANGNSCGIMISNYSELDSECKLELSGLPDEVIEIRITDKEHTFDKICEYKCKDRLEYTVNIGSNTVIYIGTAIGRK